MSERPRRGTANERIGQQAVDLAVARKEREALREALRTFGSHRSELKGAESPCWPICSCGFASALEIGS